MSVFPVSAVQTGAAAGLRIEHHRPGFLSHAARRAERLAVGVGQGHAPGVLVDEQLAGAAAAREQLDVRRILGLAEVTQVEVALATLAHLHVPVQLLHLATRHAQRGVLAKAVNVGLLAGARKVLQRALARQRPGGRLLCRHRRPGRRC